MAKLPQEAGDLSAGVFDLNGDMLAQAAVPVASGDTVETLHERIKIEERRLLVGAVAALARHGATVTGREVTIP